jgi:hypothetical protein
LFEAIERGDFPKWKFSVQIMPESDVGKHWYNTFDLTKVWPHKERALIDVTSFSAAFSSADRPDPGRLSSQSKGGRGIAAILCVQSQFNHISNITAA